MSGICSTVSPSAVSCASNFGRPPWSGSAYRIVPWTTDRSSVRRMLRAAATDGDNAMSACSPSSRMSPMRAERPAPSPSSHAASRAGSRERSDTRPLNCPPSLSPASPDASSTALPGSVAPSLAIWMRPFARVMSAANPLTVSPPTIALLMRAEIVTGTPNCTPALVLSEGRKPGRKHGCDGHRSGPAAGHRPAARKAGRNRSAGFQGQGEARRSAEGQIAGPGELDRAVVAARLQFGAFQPPQRPDCFKAAVNVQGVRRSRPAPATACARPPSARPSS